MQVNGSPMPCDSAPKDLRDFDSFRPPYPVNYIYTEVSQFRGQGGEVATGNRGMKLPIRNEGVRCLHVGSHLMDFLLIFSSRSSLVHHLKIQYRSNHQQLFS